MTSCSLTQFLEPNKYDWRGASRLHPPTSERQNLYKLDNDGFFRSISTTKNFKHLIGRKKYVYFRANYDFMEKFQQASALNHSKLEWMKDLNMDTINARIFKTIFKPSKSMREKLEKFKSEAKPPGDKLACAHIRMGTNPTNPRDVRVNHSVKDLPVVWQFLNNQTQDGRYKIFLMSDSDQVAALARAQDFGSRLVTSSGPTIHVDKPVGGTSPEVKCRGLEKVILEHLILSRYCDVLLTSRSSLSRLAAYLRHSDHRLYCLMHSQHELSNQIVKCEAKTIRHLYKVPG